MHIVVRKSAPPGRAAGLKSLYHAARALDALTKGGRRATEVERRGSAAGLRAEGEAEYERDRQEYEWHKTSLCAPEDPLKISKGLRSYTD